MRSTLLSIACLGLCLLQACSQGQSAGNGTTSEVPNTVAVRLRNPDGRPASRIPALLRPADYLASSLSPDPQARPSELWTDEAGILRIPVDSTERLLEVFTHGLGALLPIAPGMSDQLGTLRPVGSIASRALDADGNPLTGIVQIVGLERGVRTDAQGAFAIAGLPPGVFRLRFVPDDERFSPWETTEIRVLPATAAHPAPIVVPESLPSPDTGTASAVVDPGVTGSRTDTLLLPLSAYPEFWAELHDFPLLVRLGSDYSFDATNPDGSDLRAFSHKGRPLPFRVLAWDKAGRTGMLRILVDTLEAGRDARILLLQGASGSAPAYAPGRQPLGEWALGSAGGANATTGGACQWHGAGLPQVVPGMVGEATRFDGRGYFDCGGVEVDSGFALSAWVQIDAFRREAWIAGAAHATATRNTAFGIASADSVTKVRTMVTLDSGDVHLTCFGTQRDHEWFLVSLSWDGTRVKARINGNRRTGNNRLAEGGLIGTSLPFTLGGSAFHPGLTGALDEVQLLRDAQPDLWFWLRYQTERVNADLVQLRPE